MLGWKQIRGSDVTKCYQQAAGLVLMIADEGDKLLIAAYLNDVLHNDRAARDCLCLEGSSSEFALLITKGYRKWLLLKQRTSTDQKFKKLVNFVLMVDDYREFRMALNTGDAVMIKYLYNNFLPKFYPTKKKNYVKIILTQMISFIRKLGQGNSTWYKSTAPFPSREALTTRGSQW